MAADAESSDGPDNTAPSVRYVGRVDLSDPRGGKFSWSGTGVVARFTGTSLAVTLAGGQEYTVVLDGEPRPKLVPLHGRPTPIAQGLRAGEHVVALYRRTEASQGISQFLGFDFGPGGTLLAAPPAAARGIEIIGDSISCGYGNEATDGTSAWSLETENHYLTYGAIAARALNAELSTVAWSGKGIVCNYGDDPNDCLDPMPVYFERTLGSVAESRWDFSRFQPDAVVINLGTNDLCTPQKPSEVQFVRGYGAFLRKVREKYPRALILCTCGPLLSGKELKKARRYIDQAIEQTGDMHVTAFDFAPQLASDGLGADSHPSLKTHAKMADTLVSTLQDELGW